MRRSDEAFATLESELERQGEQFKALDPNLGIGVKPRPFGMDVRGLGLSLSLSWDRSANTIEGAELTVGLWDHRLPLPRVQVRDEPRRLGKRAFKFDLRRSGDAVWIEDDGNQREYPSEALADDLLKWLIAHSGPHK